MSVLVSVSLFKLTPVPYATPKWPIARACFVSLILGDPGAVSRVNKLFVVKVYCKIETSPWALTLTEPVPEAFELPASDWPEKIFSGQSAKRSCRVTLVFSYTT